MKPTGQVSNVDVPPSLLKSLTDNGAGVNNVLSEDMLKQMMGQSSVTLPEGAISVDSTWETKQNVQLPFGTISVTSRMTYKGRDPQNGYAVIAMQPTVAVKPNKDSPIQVQLTGSNGEGVILFDQQGGRIVRSDLTLNLQMQLKQFGQTMTQNVEQRTEMQLVQ
jgi:nucleoid DNA-binding protein